METEPQAVFLKGNLSEGFRAYGPYASWDEAAMAHDFQEGWIITLRDPKPLPKEVYTEYQD